MISPYEQQFLRRLLLTSQPRLKPWKKNPRKTQIRRTMNRKRSRVKSRQRSPLLRQVTAFGHRFFRCHFDFSHFAQRTFLKNFRPRKNFIGGPSMDDFDSALVIGQLKIEIPRFRFQNDF